MGSSPRRNAPNLIRPVSVRRPRDSRANQVRESERIKQPKHPNLVRAAAPAGRARAERIRFEDTLQPAARPEKLLNLLTIRHGGDQMVTARRPERILVRAGSERPASRPRVADCSRCA